MSEINQILNQTIRISGQGNDKQKAIGDALASIRKQIISKDNSLALRIVPEKVNVVSAIAETYKEHFLFFFFPRKRTIYKVVLDVDVTITNLNIEAITFTDNTVSSPDKIALPNFKALIKGEK